MENVNENIDNLGNEMQNIIFIIGNGFDLTLGLKTKYIDFFENIIYYKNFGNNIEKYIKLEPDLDIQKLCLKKIYELEEKRLEKDFEYTDYNMLGIYLYKKSKELDKNDLSWTSVEEEILNYVVDSLRIYKGKKEEKNLYFKTNLLNSIKNEEELGDFFYREIAHFEFMFGLYINDLKPPKKHLDTIKKIFKIDDKCRKKIKIINFNYTTYLLDMLQNYVVKKDENTDKQIEVEHLNIHGIYKNPIFGFDLTELEEFLKSNFQESDINNLKNILMRLTKTSKVMISPNIDENWSLPDSVDEINFYGHSLSRADYSYFQSIFDFYEIYSSKTKLNFYYNENYEGSLERVQKAILNLMEVYGESFDNKAKGKNLIHKMLLENRVKLIPLNV